MNRIVLALGVASSLLVSSLVPAIVSANGHMTSHTSHMSMKHSDKFSTYLIAHGYYADGASLKERRMGTMKFQSENGLRETGSLNIQTRVAIMRAMKLPNIVETAIATPILSTLVAAVQAGGLVDTLATG
jgi:hypothetical protein